MYLLPGLQVLFDDTYAGSVIELANSSHIA